MAAAAAAARGAKPAVVWHSGKLRARQTALAFWRACNALAEFSATPDLQPGDSPSRMRERLRGETRDVLIAGHFPHLPGLLSLLLNTPASFPQHGVVALETTDEGETWQELWRVESDVKPTRRSRTLRHSGAGPFQARSNRRTSASVDATSSSAETSVAEAPSPACNASSFSVTSPRAT